MDVRAKNRGRLHRKMCFPAAPMTGRNFLTPGHPSVRVRNVHGKSGPKFCVYVVFLPWFCLWKTQACEWVIAQATLSSSKIVWAFEFLSPLARICSMHSQAAGPFLKQTPPNSCRTDNKVNGWAWTPFVWYLKSLKSCPDFPDFSPCAQLDQGATRLGATGPAALRGKWHSERGSERTSIQRTVGECFLRSSENYFSISVRKLRKAVVVAEANIQERVPEGGPDFPAAIFLAGKSPNPGRDSISCCRKIGEEFSSSVEIYQKTFQQGISDSHSLLEFSRSLVKM